MEMKKTIIIILTVLLVLGIYLKKDNINILGEKIDEFNMVNSYDRLEESKFGIFKDRIIHWTGDKVEISKIDGEELLSLGMNIDDPLIQYGKNYIYFANPEEGQIYFVNEKAEIVERIETGKKIFSIKEIGDYLVYHNKEDSEESIGIVNKKGEKVMRYEFPEENILDYNIDQSGEILVLSKLELEDGSIKSCVEKYESGSKSENLYFQDEIIIDIQLIDKNDVILVSDSNIYRVKAQEILWKQEFDLIKDIKFESNKIYILYSNYLEILDLNGKSEEKMDFNEDYSNIQIKKTGIRGLDILLNSSARFTLIKSNGDIVTKKQIVEQVDFYEDYYFVLDSKKYGKYDIVRRVLEIEKEEEK